MDILMIREYDFFDIKAVMENVLSALSIRDYKIRRTNYPVFHPGVSAEFIKNDVILARFGELHPAVLDKWNIKRIVYGFTISLPDIMILQELRLTIKNSKISFCGKRSCGSCTGTVIK